MNRGKYIVIEGNDGTGKGEQVKRLISRLGSVGITSSQIVEPGQTDAGTEIRKIVKNDDFKLDGLANAMLFTANRRDIWVKIIEPNLENGIWVIGDRSWLSTAAYQVSAQGTPGLDIESLQEMTAKFVGKEYVEPNIEIVLSLEERRRKERLENRGTVQEAPDAFETQDEAFQNRVTEGYLAVAALTGAQIVNAFGTEDEVEQRIWELVEPLTK